MSRLVRYEVALLAAALALAASPLAARADGQMDAKREARKHFDRAMELVEDGQLGEAVIEFRRSYELQPHYTVLYNLGQAYTELAKPVEAADALQRYLQEGGKAIKPARRAEVERDIARQRARIATLEIKVQPEGAKVYIDGGEIGKAPLAASVSVGIGEHVVSATADGHEPAESKVTVAGEDRKTVELTLKPLAEKKAEPPPAPASATLPAAAPAVSQPPVTPATSATTPATPSLTPGVSTTVETSTNAKSSRGLNRLEVAGVVMAAVGLAGFVAAPICWTIGKGRHEDAVRYWNMGEAYDTQANELLGQANNYATATTISLIAGSVLTAGGAVLFGVGMAQKAPAASAHASILPTIGPGFAGIATTGRW
jgi:PEGA domain